MCFSLVSLRSCILTYPLLGLAGTGSKLSVPKDCDVLKVPLSRRDQQWSTVYDDPGGLVEWRFLRKRDKRESLESKEMIVEEEQVIAQSMMN